MSVTGVNERLAALTAAGTSMWLDQMRRGMIEDGELQRMVDEDSLRGVTSNPAIFEKAILGSPDYDEDLAAAAREGLSAREVYRRLAVKDVQLAADVLRPPPGRPCGLVFLDPPYGQNQVAPAAAALRAAGWFAPDAVLVVETGVSDPAPDLPDLLARFAHGAAAVHVFRA